MKKLTNYQRMKNYRSVVPVMAIVMLFSCKSNPVEDKITSGRIDYKITYLNTNLDKKTLELLPKEMKLLFDEKQAVNNIEGFLGFYKLDAITDFHTRKCSTLLKVFDKHYLFQGRRDEMMCCFDTMEEMEIRSTAEKKTIAGFECTKALAFLPSTGDTIVIYYTNDISLKHPNATNPYKEINGVLMEFELKLLHLKMRFTAENYQSQQAKIGEAIFPKNTRYINRDQMTKLLNKLMD